MQGIYNDKPETNHVPRVYNVAAIRESLFMLHLMLFPVINILCSALVLSEVCAQCPICLFSVVLGVVPSSYGAEVSIIILAHTVTSPCFCFVCACRVIVLYLCICVCMFSYVGIVIGPALLSLPVSKLNQHTKRCTQLSNLPRNTDFALKCFESEQKFALTATFLSGDCLRIIVMSGTRGITGLHPPPPLPPRSAFKLVVSAANL
jgi:hypothetical protein